MSLHERFTSIINFRLVPSSFNGDAELLKLLGGGRIMLVQRKMDEITRDASEYPNDEDAIKFLKGEKNSIDRAGTS